MDGTEAELAGGDGGSERGWRAAFARLTTSNRIVLAAVAVGLAILVAVLLIDDDDAGAAGSSSAGSFVSLTAAEDRAAGLALCSAWSPAQIAGTAVELPESPQHNLETVAEAGPFALVRHLGNPAGYATLAEADAIAHAAVGVQADNYTAAYRWIVVRYGDAFYPFAARYYDTVIGEGTDNPVLNSNPPCTISPSDASVQAWHALNHVGYYPPIGWVRFDQNNETLPDGQLTMYPPDQWPPTTGKRSAEGPTAPGDAPRVVNGSPATIEDYPWQVALAVSRNVVQANAADRQICGGTLLSNTIVLTAAHCLLNGTKIDTNPSRYSVIAGRTSLSSDEGEEVVAADVRVAVDAAGNPRFDTRTFGWDVALVELPEEVTGESLELAGPGDAATWDPGSRAFVSGWGALDIPNGDYPDHLQHAQVEMIGDAECSESFGAQIHATTVCAGVSGGRGTCTGDSGGPLVVVSPEADILLAGVTSFGGLNTCILMPHGFARVGAEPLHSWIEDEVAAMTDAGA